MNSSMASLLKGAIAVAAVFACAVGIAVGLFHYSPDSLTTRRHSEAHGGTPPGGTATAGASAPAPAAGSAPAAAVASNTAAPAAAATPAAAAPATSPAAAPATPPAPVKAARLGTDFSSDNAAWETILKGHTDPQQGQALATAGRPASGVVACASCHGAQGVPGKESEFPALAGMRAEYLAKQLVDFRAGTRANPLMMQIAKSLTDEDIGVVSRYYENLPVPALVASKADPADRGRYLHEFGDNNLALAACVNCHGANGAGEGVLLPRLGGQPAQYLLDQLEAFRKGERKNDDVGTMQAIAKRLNAADSQALASFYSSLAP